MSSRIQASRLGRAQLEDNSFRATSHEGPVGVGDAATSRTAREGSHVT